MECPICYEHKPPIVLACKHALCKDCHEKISNHVVTYKCPMCRANYKGKGKPQRTRVHLWGLGYAFAGLSV